MKCDWCGRHAARKHCPSCRQSFCDFCMANHEAFALCSKGAANDDSELDELDELTGNLTWPKKVEEE